MPSDSNPLIGNAAVSTVTVSTKTPRSDALIVAVGPGDKPEPVGVLAALGFGAKPGSTATVGSPSVDAGAPITVYVRVGATSSLEDLRLATAKALRSVGKATTVSLDFGTLTAGEVSVVTEAIILTTYRFITYKDAKATKSAAHVSKVTIVHPDARKAAIKKAVERGTIVATAVCQARDWVNTPPRDLRPPAFAEAIKAGAAHGVKVQIWDEKKLERERCGGILSVGQGSSAPPRLVKVTYTPAKAQSKLALVGKGITFDSGGLSIKTGVGMQTMKCDMGGAAAIVAAVNAIATLGLPVQVTGFACLAENMPGATATPPRDVIKMRNGKSVEILNTDAEGRMVLGDGLALALESQPDHIVDVATLTGAALVALGATTAAVLGNSEDLELAVLGAAAEAGEAMWRLPITEEVAEQVTASSIADLRQIGTKPVGGTLFAAAFLREFVADASWVHLDIAGPAFNDGAARGYLAPGGTGFAVRTLVQYATSLA